jgi:hypothetical protein
LQDLNQIDAEPSRYEELLHRKKQLLSARSSFKAWCLYAGYPPAAHHVIIIETLERAVEYLFKALVRGHEVPEEKLRYIFMTPPGTAKSTYISKLFPPWFLAQVPRLKKMMKEAGRTFVDIGILATTHNGDLCVEFGSAARNLVDTNEQVLGYNLVKTSRAAEAWTTSNGSYYRGATVGSGISGRRAHVGFVDDFIGNEEDATSKLVNNKIYTWWENDFVNRLQPISLRFIIANHRNEDDLIGRLLGKERPKWEVIRFRLIIENEEQADEDPLHRHVGDFIWPEYFTREMVDERMSNPKASGIQQQEPAAAQGNFFKTEMLLGYSAEDLPRILTGRCYGASDHAVRLQQVNDESCLGIGFLLDGLLYISPDLTWDRIPTDKAVTQMMRYLMEYKPLCWWAEKENISGSIGPFLNNAMREAQKWMNVIEVPHKSKDLMQRSQTINALMANGRVRFPKFATWWSRAERQLLAFPNAKHDDFVSFLAHMGMGIDKMITGKTPKVVIQPTVEEIVRHSFTPTMAWVKDSHRRKERLRILSLRD